MRPVNKLLLSQFGSRADNRLDLGPSDRAVLHVLLVKPTRYDDDGYPIHWLRSTVPSNSLACMYGIAMDCASRQVLGPDVEIRITAIDEAQQLVDYRKLIAATLAAGQRLFLCLAGVQSNQFPRAVDIAQPFLRAGLPVCIGGFHVSGCVSLLDELPDELTAANAAGISLFAGEAEDRRLDQVILDAWRGALQPLYDYTKDLVDLEDQPLPDLPLAVVRGNITNISTIDLGRGCPFECSFCCIINVQGRKSRSRSIGDLERMVRLNYARGMRNIFITDDNFARNRNWEAYLDKLIELRDEGIKPSYIIQVDTLSHRIPGFIEKSVAAGVDQVFVGLENINPENLAAMKKRQNKITEYRKMLLAWKRHPVIVWGAYIIGLPGDTRESVLRDVDIIKRELPIDLFNASILTPLPGSEDHKRMLEAGTWMDPDLNKYDLAHRVFHHAKMTDEELDSVYQETWDRYYTFEHMITVLRRMFALGSNKKLKTVERLIAFGVNTRMNDLRSYDMGWIRRKPRHSRRPGMPIEPFFAFHAKHVLNSIKALAVVVYQYNRLVRAMRKLAVDPERTRYSDIAITPPASEDFDNLELFTVTAGSRKAVEKAIRHDAIKAQHNKRPDGTKGHAKARP